MLESGVFSLLGVFLGWGLNQLTHYLDNKPKLAFIITDNNKAITPVEKRTKTSLSEYKIEMINIGKVPVILERFSLYYEKKLLVDCFLADGQRKILPNTSKCYLMMEQEKDTLQWHCDKELFSKCNIIAYCFDGQRISATLDISAVYGKSILKNGLVGRKK